jgi:hypothetical protein
MIILGQIPTLPILKLRKKNWGSKKHPQFATLESGIKFQKNLGFYVKSNGLAV